MGGGEGKVGRRFGMEERGEVEGGGVAFVEAGGGLLLMSV